MFQEIDENVVMPQDVPMVINDPVEIDQVNIYLHMTFFYSKF